MNTDQDFAEFVEARWASLYRLAYLLAASPTGAEDVLQATLEKAYVHWPRITGMEFPEAYLRRMLANTLVSNRRRAWIGEQPWKELPETGGASAEVPPGSAHYSCPGRRWCHERAEWGGGCRPAPRWRLRYLHGTDVRRPARPSPFDREHSRGSSTRAG
jgi:hypothetical protein